FFTYTNFPQWDEIDIEFLGKDTTKVQFNYFTGGTGGHEYLFDLGFDASEEFHEYGFLWQSDSIIWFVDGKAVYKATENIPQNAAKIMANVWNGKGVDDWLGAFDASELPVTAQYKWIGYKAD
ncbi:MAG: family 16 glycosylhydrolase, partial [Clostridia bacterium]|nr:family 16 glycosylhydrolase [Clostridia bacterium]